MDKYCVSILLCIVQRLSVNGQMLVSQKEGVIVSSSSQNYRRDIYNISYALDGNSRTDARRCDCCSATELEFNPWFKVDLLQEYMIQRIHILGTTDYYNTLYTMEIQLNTTESDGTVLQGVNTSDTSLHELDFTLTSPEPARYITLTLRDEFERFIICEIFVYAECSRGKYGPGCINKCGKCQNNEPCDGVTGACPLCTTGYKYPQCQECEDDTYGLGCEYKCGNCFNGVPCNKVDGSCASCAAGYEGNTCHNKCEDGTFGLGCDEKCGNCFNGESCNKTNGSCSSCATGYKGSTCFNKCQAGTFGFNCRQRCGMCHDGDVCDIYTGACPNGCTDEYKGSQCSQKINQDTLPCSDACISLPISIVSLCAVVIATVIGLGWLYYRKRLNKKSQNKGNNEDPPIPLPNIQSNYENLRLDNLNGESTYTEINRRA